ncbi:hypothetical protein HDU99_000631 [Rhizoclosmatium hyalinum]|nr:hypothetical protein HDU99_000631 [Rhizoclosmatium hyalinum]
MTLGLPPQQTACSLQPDCGASAFSQQVNNFAGITPPGEGIKTEDHSGQIWIAGIGYQSPWAAVGMAVGCCAGLAIGLLLLQQRAIARQESLFGDDFENKTAVNINQTTENIAEEPVTMPTLIPLQELEEIVVQESTQKEDTALPQLNEAPEYELRSYDNLNLESREEAKNLYSAVNVTSYCEQEQSDVSPPLEVTPLPSITPDVNEEALSLPLQQPTVSSTEPVAQDIPSAAPPKIDKEPIKSQDLERESVVVSERSSFTSERRPSHVKELKARFEANALELKAKKLEEYKPVPKAKIKVVVETMDILANTNQEVLEIQKPPTQSHVKPNDTILPHLVIPAIDVPVVEVAPIQPLSPEPSLKANIEGPPVEVVPSISRRPSTKLEPIQEDKPLDFGRKVRHGRKSKSLYKQQLQQEFIKEYGYAVGKDTEGSNSSISSSGSNRSNNAKEESN